MAKKMGTNPLTGLNGLIRSTQEAPAAPEIPAPRARKTRPAQDAPTVQAAQDVPETQVVPKARKAQGAQNAQPAPIAHEAQGAPVAQATHPARDPQYALNAQEVQRVYKAQKAHHEYDALHALNTPSAQEIPDAITSGFQRDGGPLAGSGAEPRERLPSPATQGRKGQKLPRINMAFSPELLAYVHAMAGFERMSATQYVNNLIRGDMQRRKALYEQLNALRGE